MYLVNSTQLLEDFFLHATSWLVDVMGVVTTQVDWLGSSKIVNINVIVDVFNIQLGPKKNIIQLDVWYHIYISSIVDQCGSLTSRMDDVHNDRNHQVPNSLLWRSVSWRRNKVLAYLIPMNHFLYSTIDISLYDNIYIYIILYIYVSVYNYLIWSLDCSHVHPKFDPTSPRRQRTLWTSFALWRAPIQRLDASWHLTWWKQRSRKNRHQNRFPWMMRSILKSQLKFGFDLDLI